MCQLEAQVFRMDEDMFIETVIDVALQKLSIIIFAFIRWRESFITLDQ